MLRWTRWMMKWMCKRKHRSRLWMVRLRGETQRELSVREKKVEEERVCYENSWRVRESRGRSGEARRLRRPASQIVGKWRRIVTVAGVPVKSAEIKGPRKRGNVKTGVKTGERGRALRKKQRRKNGRADTKRFTHLCIIFIVSPLN